MTYTKLLELEERFSKKIAQDDKDKSFKFYHKLIRDLYAIVNEMDGDLLVLRELRIDSIILKKFKELKEKLITLVKEIHPSFPSKGIYNLIEWVNERNNKALINNLNYIIQSFLKDKGAQFQITPHVKPAAIESLTKLKNIIRIAHDYIEKDPREAPTIPPPPALRKEEPISVITEEVTKPGIPAKKEAI